MYDESLEALVAKYQKYIISVEYLERLNIAKDRADSLFDIYEQVNNTYKHRIRTIERIKNQEYDPDFNTEGLIRGLYLE